MKLRLLVLADVALLTALLSGCGSTYKNPKSPSQTPTTTATNSSQGGGY
jgi:hypothetical protein